MTRLIAAGLLALLTTLALAAGPPTVVVGSKRFTESYVLGEIVRQTLQQSGVAAEHKPGLGNTGILEQALASGAVDVYPEYTGTIVRELLKRSDAADANPSLDQLNTWLAPRGLKAAVPLGFNNTYALAVSESVAQRLALRSISDLARLPAGALKAGLSHEFQQRADGWPALRRAYGLALTPGAALDHGLAYAALEAGQVDLIDVYSTDAQLGRRAVRVLVDDRGFFPRYDAVLLMRAAVDATPLQGLAGRLDGATMVRLNAQVEIDGLSFAEVARRFLAAPADATAAKAAAAPGASASAASASAASPVASGTAAPVAETRRAGFAARLFAPDLGRLLLQHLGLVFGSVALAVAFGVPMGVWAWRRPRWAGGLLGAVGVLQTVPSLALLAFLIAMLGVIGFVPALLALFVYALLPIVKTAAVINVGTATVAAFVGAGGLGERIVAGLAVNDRELMLAGALPAALLAVAVQWAFDAWERRWAGRGAA
jgi:osmoprotectant transport system permease protein